LEQRASVRVGARDDRSDVDAQYLGDDARGIGDVTDLVALAAVRDRREIRAVGLEDDRVESDLAHGVAQRLRGLERHHAADPQHQVQLARKQLGLGRRPGKTVHHAALRARIVSVPQRGHEVVVRLPLMKDQRQRAVARVGELRREDGALDFARAVIVVIVEPGLADRDDVRAEPFAQRVQGARQVGRRVLRLVRMDPDGRGEP